VHDLRELVVRRFQVVAAIHFTEDPSQVLANLIPTLVPYARAVAMPVISRDDR
jgi:hypothetical protein